jgi:dolichol-phosphate mannosyltransferase
VNQQVSPDDDLGRVLVIIPTYNERDNVEPIVERVVGSVPDANVLIVDDGSPDGTGKVADELAADDPRIRVLHRSEKAGLGAAYIAGFGWGLEHDYGVLVEMDADGSHSPEQLPALLGALRDADVVLGSRWVAGGTVVNWPMARELWSRGANLYTRIALGMRLRDATGGYRAYRRATIERIGYQAVASQGYCFQIDLAWRASRAGLRVVEVPITFTDREHGESKMSGAVAREALWRVTAWGARHRADQVRRALRRRGS